MSACIKMLPEKTSVARLQNEQYRVTSQITLYTRDQYGISMSLAEAELTKNKMACLLYDQNVRVLRSTLRPKTRAGVKAREMREKIKEFRGVSHRPFVTTLCRAISFTLLLDTQASGYMDAIAVLKAKVEAIASGLMSSPAAFTPASLKESTSTASTLSTTETVDSLTDELEAKFSTLLPSNRGSEKQPLASPPSSSPPTVMAAFLSEPPVNDKPDAPSFIPSPSPIRSLNPSVPLLPGIGYLAVNHSPPTCLVPWSCA